MTRLTLLFLAISLTLAPCSHAAWDEMTDGGGDAGQTLSNHQGTQVGTGPGVPLDFITGTNPPVAGGRAGNDVDLYRIYIDDPMNFKASTNFTPMTDALGNLWDTMLFLFDDTGRGVAMNDNVNTPSGVGRSELTTASLMTAFPPITLSTGFYYIGIGPQMGSGGGTVNEVSPFSSSGVMFPPGGTAVVHGPTTAGADPLVGWNQSGTEPLEAFNDTYSIMLTGVLTAPSAIPEPSAFLFLAACLGGPAAYRRYRRVLGA